jgi:hypothetical protein
MTPPPTTPLGVGLVFVVRFETFTPQITIRSADELTVEIVDGSYGGFSDTVEYEAVAIREDVVLLSWQEHNESTIVHVLDFSSLSAHTAVTPADGEFMRLVGQIEIKTEP